MSRRSEVIVLAFPRDDVHAWLGTLLDWNAAGLVRDLLVVASDEVPSSGSWPCLRIAAGRLDATSIETHLAAGHSVAGVTLACVSNVGPTFSSLGSHFAERLRRAITNALPGAAHTWLHVLAVGVPDDWPDVPPGEVAWVGVHNVVLAPENSASPDSGVLTVDASDRARPESLTLMAAALASAVGLWRDDPTPPLFTGEAPAGGGQVVMLRSWSRHLSDHAAIARVTAECADMSRGYPVPTGTDGRHLQRVTDDGEAAKGMAEALVDHHEALKLTPLRSSGQGASDTMSLGALLRQLGQFLLHALKGSPEAFLRSLQEEFARVVLPKAQARLLGVDAGVAVSVAGQTAVPTAADAKSDTPEGARRESRSAAYEYPELWRDLVRGGLTLIDAKQRRDHLPVRRAGYKEAVVSHPRAVGPAPGTKYGVPAELRAIVDIPEVAAHDSHASAVVRRAVEAEVHDQPGRAAALRRHLDDLTTWQQTHRGSYIAEVGAHLATTIATAQGEADAQREVVRRLSTTPEITDQDLRTQRSLAFQVLALIAVVLVGAGAMVWAAYTDRWEWRETTQGLVVLVVVAAVLYVVIFYVRQRRILQAFHRRRGVLNAIEVAKRNLDMRNEDLLRLGELNRQFVAWGDALGTFAHAPWGDPDPLADQATGRGAGYCHNHRFGVAVPTDEAIRDRATDLGSAFYEIGWTTRAWKAFLADLPYFEGRKRLEQESDLLFADRLQREGSVLSAWSQAVQHHHRSQAGGPLGALLDQAMATSGDQQFGATLGPVQWQEQGGQNRTGTYSEFMGGLDPALRSDGGSARQFSQLVFADVTDTVDPWLVERAECATPSKTHPVTRLTEVSRAFGARDLAFCDHGTAAVDEWSPRATGPVPQV